LPGFYKQLIRKFLNMKQLILILFAGLAMVNLAAQEATINYSDFKAIENVIQVAYVEGLQNEGDTTKINSGFHPGFELLIPLNDGETFHHRVEGESQDRPGIGKAAPQGG
jgi:hypothetical protein